MEKGGEQEEGTEEAPSSRRKDRDVVVGLGRVMEKVVDKVMDRMMEKVMDKMVEKWKLENKDRVERTVVETMNETIEKLTGDARNSEEELGKKLDEIVNRVVKEVALIMERMMQQVEQKLEGEGGSTLSDDTSDGSVCEMPPYDPDEDEDQDEEEEEEEEDEEIFEEPPLTPNQREAFLEVFRQLTQADAEIIDISSLKSAMTDLEICVNEADIYNILEALDSNGDGEANFEDFLNLATSTRLFFLFYKELPDHCEGSQLQTGSVDNSVFFEILSKFIQTQMLSEDTTRIIIRYYYIKKKGAKLKSKKHEPCPKQVLPPPMFLGQTIYSLATYVDILEPDEEYNEIPLTEEQVKAFRDVFDMFCRDKQDCIDVSSLLNMMSEVQLYLKNPLIPNEMKCAEVNWGKEVSFNDFLDIMTDTETFARYLTPQYEVCKTTVATPVVIFQAINKLVDSPLLSGKTKGIVGAYYRNKFINAAQGYGDDMEPEGNASPGEAETPEETPETPMPGTPPSKASDIPVSAEEEAKEAAAAKEGAKGAAKEGAAKEAAKEGAKGAKGAAKEGAKGAAKGPARESARELAKKSYSRKTREASIRRKQLMQKRFEQAMKNPAFHQAFNAYSWTWKEKQAKQKQEVAPCS